MFRRLMHTAPRLLGLLLLTGCPSPPALQAPLQAQVLSSARQINIDLARMPPSGQGLVLQGREREVARLGGIDTSREYSRVYRETPQTWLGFGGTPTRQDDETAYSQRLSFQPVWLGPETLVLAETSKQGSTELVQRQAGERRVLQTPLTLTGSWQEGAYLYLSREQASATVIQRLDLGTGERTDWRTLRFDAPYAFQNFEVHGGQLFVAVDKPGYAPAEGTPFRISCGLLSLSDFSTACMAPPLMTIYQQRPDGSLFTHPDWGDTNLLSLQLALSPDRRYLAYQSGNRQIAVIDALTGAELTRQPGLGAHWIDGHALLLLGEKGLRQVDPTQTERAQSVGLNAELAQSVVTGAQDGLLLRSERQAWLWRAGQLTSLLSVEGGQLSLHSAPGHASLVVHAGQLDQAAQVYRLDGTALTRVAELPPSREPVVYDGGSKDWRDASRLPN
ncbi:MAG: hypothetical protein ACO1RX_07550 [Candidatus Sericytochromatia bacterium]